MPGRVAIALTFALLFAFAGVPADPAKARSAIFMSAREATVNQQRAARSGRYPTGPLLGSSRDYARIPGGRKLFPRFKRPRAHRWAPSFRLPRGEAAALWQKRRGEARASVLGQWGDYGQRSRSLVAYVQGYFERQVPLAGGRFRPPTFFPDVPDGSRPFRCTGGGVDNLAYCPVDNSVSWAVGYSNRIWTDIGDNSWLTPLAHEFGHGAEGWLGYANRGLFDYTIYKENFADCMAGAWAQAMFAAGLFDTVGRGDTQEISDFFQQFSVPGDVTWRPGSHGDFEFRMSAVAYGWNLGFGGCIDYGNYLSTHRRVSDRPERLIATSAHTLPLRSASKRAGRVFGAVAAQFRSEGTKVQRATGRCRRGSRHVVFCTLYLRMASILADQQGRPLPGSPTLTLSCQGTLRLSQRSRRAIVRIRVARNSVHCKPARKPKGRQPRKPSYKPGTVLTAGEVKWRACSPALAGWSCAYEGRAVLEQALRDQQLAASRRSRKQAGR